MVETLRTDLVRDKLHELGRKPTEMDLRADPVVPWFDYGEAIDKATVSGEFTVSDPSAELLYEEFKELRDGSYGTDKAAVSALGQLYDENESTVREKLSEEDRDYCF